MSEDITITHLRHRSPAASTSSTPARHTPTSQATTPRLGDFSRLHSSSLAYTPDDKPASLGNFSKIFTTLTPSVPTTPSKGLGAKDDLLGSPIERGSPGSTPVRDIPDSLTSVRDALRRKLFLALTPSTTDSELEDSIKTDTDHSSITPQTTPPSSLERDPPPIASLSQPKPPQFDVTETPKAATPLPQSHLQHIFSYQFFKHGPQTAVYDEPRSVSEQHESLTQRLISHRAVDTALQKCYPKVVENGIHVFLDMSNINISFQQALRNRYQLAENARFVPLPQLNLDFLTEIFVRGREVNVLNAGCSVQPGRSEPHFVRELRALDYHVDLRERKRTEEPTPRKNYGHYSSSDEASMRRQVRYVEDLVDETLQTRIAESVMEHFSNPGTLIIATGDAKPAKYSDGFFTYADRALKMGWHVEVVSWRSSLSHSWRNPEWTALWGDKFRLIELDDFLDDLLLVSD